MNGGGLAADPRLALRALPWVAFGLSCWPLLSGFPQGHDWLFELVRVAEYRAATAAGQLPPHWAENLYGGYGSPIFLFYAPLFAAGASLLAAVLGSIASGATGWVIALSAVSVFATQKLLECAARPWRTVRSDPERIRATARVGVYVYVLHPYLLGDKLVRNANAEFAALCLLPLVVHGLLRVGPRPRAGFALLSGGLALSILSHNLTALVAAGIALAGTLVLYPAPRPARTWVVAGGGIAFGLLLAAFFWVPALSLAPLVRTEELLRGKFDFHAQFAGVLEIFGYQRFFATGLVTPAVLVAAALAAYRYRRPGPEQRLLVAALTGALGCLFLATRASTLAWETLPLLPFFQFPWRMLGPLAFFSAIAGALAFGRYLTRRSARGRVLTELAVFGACALNALPVIGQYEPLRDEVAARLPGLLEPDAIRTGTQSATVLDEYLPRTASPISWRSQRPRRGPVIATTAAADVSVLGDRGSEIELRVRAPEPVRLRIARWSFPGWQLELDGEPAQPLTNAFGSIDVAAPAGEVNISLRYRAPPLRRGCLVLSALAGIAWLAGLAGRPRRLWEAAGSAQSSR